jgi:hypothetical protein
MVTWHVILTGRWDFLGLRLLRRRPVLKIQQWLMCGAVLIACTHGSAREDAAAGAYGPEESVRTKGGSSAAFRINALIRSGQYAEAEALIAESAASGLLTMGAAEELRDKVRKGSDEQKDKNEEDTEPKRPFPHVKLTCETAHSNLKMCYRLPDGYKFQSRQSALVDMKRSSGKNNLSLHGEDPTEGGPCPGIGTHFNVRLNGRREGSIVCCPCCLDNSERGPMELEKCRIVW